MVARYDYVDESGDLLFQVARWEPKRFTQRRPDGEGGWVNNVKGVRRVLYRLPEVMAAVETGEPVYIVEGEKDVEAMESLGVTATCNPMGAEKWLPEFNDYLTNAEVVIVVDQDEDEDGKRKGQKHARQVYEALAGFFTEDISVVAPAEGKDAADHIAAGHGLDDFVPVDPRSLPSPAEATKPKQAPRTGDRPTGLPVSVIGALVGWDRPYVRPQDPQGDWQVCCPVHDDHDPSATVAVGDERPVVFHCHVGCDQDDFFAWLVDQGVPTADLMGEGDTKGPNGGRRLSLQSMADVETRSVEWFWRHRIPFGKITNFEGDPENGKSLVTLTLAALASTGGTFPDGDRCDPAAVLLICDEDDYEDTIVPRLVAAGADRAHIFALHPEKNEDGTLIPFVMPDDLPALQESIGEVQALTGRDRTVLIIDPVTSCMSEKINTGVDASVRRALSPLQQLARETGAAIMLIRHLNKNSAERNIKYRGGGSIGFFAAARAQMVVGRDPRDPTLVVLAQGKKNLSKGMPSLGYRIEPWDDDPELPVVVWQGDVDLDADQVLNGFDARKQSPDRDLAKEVLADLLEANGGYVDAAVALKEAKKAGVSEKTMRRAADDMGIVKEKQKNDDGTVSKWLWRSPVQGSKISIRAHVEGSK